MNFFNYCKFLVIIINLLVINCGYSIKVPLTNAELSQLQSPQEASQPQTFSLDMQDLSVLIATGISHPYGLLLGNQRSNSDNTLLQRAMSIYDRIAKNNPADYLSAKKATELAVYLDNERVAIRNINRYRERSSILQEAELDTEANMYGMLVGMTFLKPQLISNAFLLVKQQNSYTDDMDEQLGRWFSVTSHDLTAKIELVQKLLKTTSDSIWVDVLAHALNGQVAKHEKLLIDYAEKYPERSMLQWVLGDYYLQKQQQEHAINYFQKLISLPTTKLSIEVRARKSLSDIYINSSQITLSVPHLNWLRENIRQYQSYANYYLGILKFNQQEYPQAVAHFKDIRLTSPFSQSGKYFYAKSQYLSGNSTAAYVVAKDLFVLWFNKKGNGDKKKQKAISLFYADILVNRKSPKKAVQVLDDYLALYPKDDDLHYQKSLLLIDLKDYEEALKSLASLIKQKPKNPEYLNSYGYLLTDINGDPNKALPYLEKAFKLAPDKAHVIDSLGWVYFHLQRYDEAVPLLKKAYELSNDPVIFFHWVETLYKMGEHQEALKILKVGESQYPQHQQVQKLKKLLKQ